MPAASRTDQGHRHIFGAVTEICAGDSHSDTSSDIPKRAANLQFGFLVSEYILRTDKTAITLNQ